MQVICDDKGRVIYIYGGWPGSTHDNRAWRNSDVFLNANDYFSEGEYLLGDQHILHVSILFKVLKN